MSLISIRGWPGRFARRAVAMVVTLFVVAPIAEATLPEPTWMLVTVAAVLCARQVA